MVDPFVVTPYGLDLATRTLLGECRGEPLLGQQGVAWVLRNRAAWQPATWWGDTLETVILKPFQFSCWNKSDPNYAKINAWPIDDPEYLKLREVARAVMAGEIDDPTGHASHYEVLGTGASWAKNREFSKVIGRHAFFDIGPG